MLLGKIETLQYLRLSQNYPLKGVIRIIEGLEFRVAQNQGYHFGGSYNKD